MKSTVQFTENAVLDKSDLTYNCVVKGPFFLTKLAIPHLKKSGEGVILFTTTSSSHVAIPIDPHYLTAKAAVDQMVRVFAGWLGPEIRVNCVVPGMVMTDMFRHHPPEVWDSMASSVPMNRMVTPEEIAKTALFLASSDSAMITAVAIPVDGGRCGAVPRRVMLPVVQKMKSGVATYEKASYGAERIKAMNGGLK